MNKKSKTRFLNLYVRIRNLLILALFLGLLWLIYTHLPNAARFWGFMDNLTGG